MADTDTTLPPLPKGAKTLPSEEWSARDDAAASDSSTPDLGPDPGVVNDFFRTLNQSWLLDPIEGGAQLAASIPV
ncbi:MAG TPA: hypothetical protein VF742_13170, partial [Terracidiphilus sp.]